MDSNVQPGVGKFGCNWLEWFARAQGIWRQIFGKCQIPTPCPWNELSRVKIIIIPLWSYNKICRHPVVSFSLSQWFGIRCITVEFKNFPCPRASLKPGSIYPMPCYRHLMMYTLPLMRQPPRRRPLGIVRDAFRLYTFKRQRLPCVNLR